MTQKEIQYTTEKDYKLAKEWLIAYVRDSEGTSIFQDLVDHHETNSIKIDCWNDTHNISINWTDKEELNSLEKKLNEFGVVESLKQTKLGGNKLK